MILKMRAMLLLAAVFGLTLSGMAATSATLKIGDTAPKLQVGGWVQGDPVKGFETGKVYVVEFWATWCAPCRESIPHLNALYQKFKDRGLVVIGQNCQEEDDSAVAPFVKKMGTNMTYRVALDDKSKDQNGAMMTAWMDASGQEGIPTAFVVNQQGLLAWMGHPMELTDKFFEDILAGHFDVTKAAADYDKRQATAAKMKDLSTRLDAAVAAQKWDEANSIVDELAKADPGDSISPQAARMELLFMQKKYDEAYKIASSLSDAHQDEAGLQDRLAWMIVARPGLDKRDTVLAQKIAERANKAANGKNASALDTLARAQFMNGKKDDAIATQQKAIDVADADEKPQLQATLKSYQDGKLPEIGGQPTAQPGQ